MEDWNAIGKHMRKYESIYLDNAATSHPKPDSVYRAVEQALRSGGSASRGNHKRSLAAGQLVFETRELLAEMFNGRDSERFVFTFNATVAINQALFGLLKPGDRVVTTSMEHNAVARPLTALAERGVEVVWVAADPQTGIVAAEDLMRACRSKTTRLLVMTHCSNVFGSIQPVPQLGSWCREQGIVFMVDASQSAGVLPIDIESMHIDLLAAPGHKGLLGPQGTGFLYVGHGIELTPLLYGGTGAYSHSLHQPLELPERFESGTYNMSGLAGLFAGLEFVRQTGIDAIRDHEMVLTSQLVEGLRCCPQARVYGPQNPQQRSAVVSFTLDGRDPAEIGYFLDEADIAVRVGLHCAPEAHRSMGTYPLGTVRVSPGFFNTPEQIDVFLEVVNGLY